MRQVRRSTCAAVAMAVIFVALSLPVRANALTTPHGSRASEFSLNGVSCEEPEDCLAVGDYADGSGSSEPSSELWNGMSWTPVQIRASNNSGLNSVACPGMSSCLAVGFARYTPLSEIWNGGVWKTLSVPAPSGQIASSLQSVACTGVSSCSAVGFYNNSASKSLNLAEHWNGTSWDLQSVPDPVGVAGSELSSVACATANSCVAVGYSFNTKGNSHSLAERWNGSVWTVVPTPNHTGGSEDVLNSVWCSGPADCTAVGDYFALSGSSYALIEDWNGTSWAIAATPADSGALLGISCAGTSRCVAVGDSAHGTFSEIRIKAKWQVVASPNPKKSSDSAILLGVSCGGDFGCSAVGQYTGVSSDTTYDLGEIWNGSDWTITRTPNH